MQQGGVGRVHATWGTDGDADKGAMSRCGARWRGVQACGLRDNMDDLKKAGVEVLGISTDKPEKLSRFAEKELLNFTLLSDENHQVCEQFGVWGEKSFMGKTYDGIHRISFLIDADGKIEHVFDDFKTSNHHDVVLNWLKENA